MFRNLVSHFTRFLLAALLLAVMALSIPQGVHAASPSFEITSVKADESVTVRTRDFPANTDFTVRMDVAGNLAINGIVVSEFNSGVGGTFEATYRIPAELKGKKTIAIRFESSKGYLTYNWFNNSTQGTTDTGSVPVTSTGLSIVITAVKKNNTITVEGRNLPANVDFKVRVGPFNNFAKKAVTTQTFNTGKGGTVVFNVTLPDVVKDVELVSVRIDGGGKYAFNVFTNADSGTIGTPSAPIAGYQCSIVSTSPTVALPSKGDFDGVWEVKNTGSKDWSMDSVDYKYMSGVKMHTAGSTYDLPKTVKPGESIKIIVDMLAPEQAGWHATTWALVQGSSTVCSLPLSIRVK